MNFKSWLLNEMPSITLKGKTAYGDESALKDLDVEALSNNIVFFRQPEGNENSFIAPGTTWIYFMDSEESAQEMKEGKIPMLMVPRGTFMSGGNPITDIWAKKHAKPGTEKILGMIEGHTDEDKIYIDMMTVRSKYRRNSITTKMIQYAKRNFPNAKVTFSSPTPQGEKFINSFKESKFLIPELPKPARTAAQTLGAEPDYKPTDFKELESLEKTIQWAKDHLKEIEYKLANEEPKEYQTPVFQKTLDVFEIGIHGKSHKIIRTGSVVAQKGEHSPLGFYPVYIVLDLSHVAFYGDGNIFIALDTLKKYSAKELTQIVMHELTHAIDPKQNTKYKASPSKDYRSLPNDSPFKKSRYVKDPEEFDARGGEIYYLIASKLKHLNDKEAIEMLNSVENWLRVGGKTPEILDSLNLNKSFEIWKTRPTLWRRFQLRLHNLIQTLKSQYKGSA